LEGAPKSGWLAITNSNMRTYEKLFNDFVQLPVTDMNMQMLFNSEYRTKSKPDTTKNLREVTGSLGLEPSVKTSKILAANKKKQDLLLYLNSLLAEYQKKIKS
jgi:PleD family two-component response regulator